MNVLAPAFALGLMFTVSTPARAADTELQVGGGTIRLSVLGTPDDPAALRRWVENSAQAVTAYLRTL